MILERKIDNKHKLRHVAALFFFNKIMFVFDNL